MNKKKDDLMMLVESTIDHFDDSYPMLRFDENVISAGLLRVQIRDTLHALEQIGVAPGSFVGYTLPNCPEVVSLFFALIKIGACAVPVFPMVPDAIKVATFAKSNVCVIITTAKQAPGILDTLRKNEVTIPLLTIDSGESCLCLFDKADHLRTQNMVHHDGCSESMPCLLAGSSGTTGIPKTLILTRSNVTAALLVAREMATGPNGEVCRSTITAFPLSTSGIIVCSGIIMAGVTAIFATTMHPAKFMEAIVRYCPSSISAPPAYLESLLHAPIPCTADVRFVSGIITGMDFFSPSLLARCGVKFPGITYLVNGYGCMETSTVVMVGKMHLPPTTNDAPIRYVLVNNNNEIDIRDDNGRSVKLHEEGELYIRGESVIKQYDGDAEATLHAFVDGWFKTGDIVRKDDDGAVQLLGRKKNMIKRGGKTVSPLVVQDWLNRHPLVETSSVVGVPHHLYGEMVWAFVVAKKGGEPHTKDLMRHCRDTLVNYMVPDQITFIAEIPKHQGVGKIDTGTLVQMALDELEKIGELQDV